MARLQAKTEEQREHIDNIFKKLFGNGCEASYSLVYTDEVMIVTYYDGIYGETMESIPFDVMAEIVDYLRQNCERDIVEESHVIAGYGDPNEWVRLLYENRKLDNVIFRLLEENKQLKEKTKNLPRIATLNKRIHELKEQLKDGNKQSI